MVSPWLLHKGFDANRLMALGLPLCLLVLAGIIFAGAKAGSAAWAVFCVSCTFVSLSQPAMAMAFPQALVGRALSAYNLVIFAGWCRCSGALGLPWMRLPRQAWPRHSFRPPWWCTWCATPAPTPGLYCWGGAIMCRKPFPQ